MDGMGCIDSVLEKGVFDLFFNVYDKGYGFI